MVLSVGFTFDGKNIPIGKMLDTVHYIDVQDIASVPFWSRNVDSTVPWISL